ncbi:MAG: 50S ribosomal protein L11 [Candidatus Liptonbacteria bacterium RIFOXYC1_FULL_36_8]|uniref:Large ribosomal subunit protein uL11 n=3 Tax=Candidatus Liptoniibacteriota TaxID=1817909 RepID=A0A1G2CRC1_9BACT|nr:MAG: 50S ribosomal protein L11 [Candidatus Liptonbacteria bacterium RIFOXYD1_FULL_36_11]OGZ03073.1 MAG: 50S ribosomal protein L11 [Candidatus Liptonbacteria bacterium RIFOXYC1_FULL_36_8]OGZ03201.1 MAG: 50S ribosomal protein L11 [Candidatus Liptonbacteria bacterium RIFOXYB1_FULL_36_10]
MAKKVKIIIKLQLVAGKATPAPPVGTALGPQGINIAEFCKQFNDMTREMDGVIPAVITIYEDRSFSFILKTSPVSALLKKAAGLEKGSKDPLRIKVGKVTKAQVEEIAKKKMEDLNTEDLAAAMKIVEGTARNMGVVVEK